MCLTKAGLLNLVKKQYLYNMKARLELFLIMAAVQLAAILLSRFASRSTEDSYGDVYFIIKFFSGDTIIWLTVLWIFAIAILITTRSYRRREFLFTSHRWSASLANILFLATASAVGGLAAVLCSALLRVIAYYTHNGASYLLMQDFYLPLRVFLAGMAATALYLLVFGSIGYLCGILVQWSRVFLVLLPAALFVSFLIGFYTLEPWFYIVFDELFLTESSLALFAAKAFPAAAFFFTAAALLSNRLEVR